MVLIKLSKLTMDIKWQSISDKQLYFISSAINGYPAGTAFFNVSFRGAVSLEGIDMYNKGSKSLIGTVKSASR